MRLTGAIAAILIVVSSASSLAAGKAMTVEQIKKDFIGRTFTWKHESGAGGTTIHKADGTMNYDINGKPRSTHWKIKGKSFCVNAGEADEWCFRLFVDGKTYRSEDGSIVYRPK